MARSRQLLPLVLAAAAAAAPLLLAARSLSRCFAAGGAPRPTGPGLRAPLVARADGPVGSGAADAKAKLMDILADDVIQKEVFKAEGRPIRGRLNEVIAQLEKLNPTEEPVYSELLDGTWEVKYTSSFAPGLFESPTRELALFLYGGGFSLGSALSSFTEGFWGGVLDVKVESKMVRIEAGRDVEATAELVRQGSKDRVRYSAELMPLSSQRMSEEIMSVEFPAPLGKQDLPLELRRTILVTYLDENLMIVRDESGVPEVLARELAPLKEFEVSGAEASSTVAEAAPVSSAGTGSDNEGEDPLISEAA